jgi:hypothetical protein
MIIPVFAITMICGVLCGTMPRAFAQDSDATAHGDAMNGSTDEVLFVEDFSDGMKNWWVEGGRKVHVKSGRLYVDANPPEGSQDGGVCTVWCKETFPGDVRVEFDAHVVESVPEVNNINFFLSYSDPSGEPLYETRDERKTAKYSLYHKLNGHIFTYLRDSRQADGANSDGSTKARFRIRRNPGFHMLGEAFDYHCEKGRTYHVVLTKSGGTLSMTVDGKVYCRATDQQPLKGGLIGLRTYRTHLWWDNIKVTEALRKTP